MHERNWTKDFNWELQAKLHLYPTFTLLSGEIHVIPHTLISITPIIIRSTLKKRDREWLWYCSFQNGSSNFILFLKKPLLTEEEKKKLNCTSFLYIYTPEYNILCYQKKRVQYSEKRDLKLSHTHSKVACLRKYN